MPDLIHTLQGNDLGFLRMVAGAWGIDLNAPDAYTALPVLVKGILNQQLVDELVETLPVEARTALQDLMQNEGHLPWALFSRRHGEVRVMGAGKRDRERPDLHPASPAEILWYRSLIGKAFLNFSDEPQEYAYIPDDILGFFHKLEADIPRPLGRPASPAESVNLYPVNDAILDQTCTLLAAIRTGKNPSEIYPSPWKIPLPVLVRFLQVAELVNEEQLPQTDNARVFLEAKRGEALAYLVRAWLKSRDFNELRLLPGLRCEDGFSNDPLQTRQTILGWLSALPQDSWWNLSSFVNTIHERHPDFQRPAGDYDSWFIYSETSGSYLRGFSTWDEVEGALIRFMITGPLHWLGLMDLASASPQGEITAFRPSRWAEALWHEAAPVQMEEETDPIRMTSDGRLLLTRLTPRPIRYQVARFGAWEGGSEGEYHYRLTTDSMERARQQGLRPSHLLSLLKRHGASPVPPNLVKAMERWEKSGSQIAIQKNTLLRVTSEDILNALKQSKAGRFLGETLNPTTVVVKPGGELQVRKALVELGFLLEFPETPFNGKDGRKNKDE